MTTIINRYTQRRLARVQTYTSSDLGIAGEAYAQAIGVDSTNRIWIGAYDPNTTDSTIFVLDPIRGEVEDSFVLSGTEVYGQMVCDLNARMWVATKEGDSVLVIDSSFATVATVDLSGSNYETRGLLFDPGANFVMVGLREPVAGDLFLAALTTTPGGEALNNLATEIAGTPGRDWDMSPVRDADGAFYMADINDAATYITSDFFSCFRVALSESNTAGGHGIDYAFGFLWLGGDARNGPGAAPATLQKIVGTTGEVLASLTFEDVTAIRAITHDSRFLYVTLDREPSVDPVECTVAKIDPFTLGILSETLACVLNPLDLGGVGPLLVHNSTAFSLPSPVLAKAQLWFDTSDTRGVSGYLDRRHLGTQWVGLGFHSQPVGGSGYAPLSPIPTNKRRLTPTVGGAGAVYARCGTRGTRVFGGGARVELDTLESLVEYPSYAAVGLDECTYLHDASDKTIAIVFRPIDQADKTLINTLSDPAQETSTGFALQWIAATQHFRVRTGNGGGGDWVIDVDTPTDSFPMSRTHVVVITYDADEELTTIYWKGQDEKGNRLAAESMSELTSGEIPSAADPDTVLTANCNMGFLFEFCTFQEILSSFEIKELFDYLGRWQVPFDPGLLPDLELWLRPDIAGTTTSESGGITYLSVWPNEGIGAGTTGTSQNTSQPFEAATGEEPYYATLGSRSDGLYFDPDRPSSLDARQSLTQFRWLHGGGAPGGGTIEGMTLAWSMRSTGTGDTQTVLSTSQDLPGTAGILVRYDGTAEELIVFMSNGTNVLVSTTEALPLNTTATCVLRVYFTGSTLHELYIDGVQVATAIELQAAADVDPFDTCRVGRMVGVLGDAFEGAIPEIVGCRRAVTDEELELLTQYLDRWK